MSIIKIELKRNFKIFCFWMLGLALLSIYGMVEFGGISNSAQGMDKLMSAFPKIVLVIFGMNNMDVTTLIGYYGILFLYILIMMALYAINLGFNTTAYEVNEKTADFIYAKPISRINITIYKQLSGLVYILLFTIISYLSIILGIYLNHIDNDANKLLILFSIVLFLIGLLYYSLGALLGAISNKKGSLIANLVLLSSYLIAIIYDLVEHNNLIRFLTPLKYFDLSIVIKEGKLPILFIGLTIIIIVTNIIFSNCIIKKKDLD